MDVAASAASPGFWVAALFAAAAALIAYIAAAGIGGRRGAVVLRAARAHVRRAAGAARGVTFDGADVARVGVAGEGEVELCGGEVLSARRVVVVDRGAHLGDGRALKVHVQRQEAGAAGEDAAEGEDRVLRFPSRLALEAFQDALLLAQLPPGEEEASVATARPHEIRLSLSTWNVGNAQPPADLARWFDAARGADVVAFGTQECSYSTTSPPGDKGETEQPLLADAQSSTWSDLRAGELSSADSDLATAANLSGKEHWQAIVRAHFPRSEYTPVVELASWDRCLNVYVRNDLAPAVSQVRSDTAFVGLGGVAGNKGAIGVRFAVYDTDFVIINSHLAAHQGHVARRNADYSAITNSMRSLRDGPTMDVLTSKSHHVFWMGDLNYRIDLPREEVLERVKAGDFRALFAADQLRKAMADGDAFFEFDEAPIDFPPTYRYERGSRVYASTKMRIPSYCDRILKRSLPGVTAKIESYTSVDSIMTSDHSPVMASVTAQLLHVSGQRSLDEIEATFQKPEAVDRGVAPGPVSSPRGVVAVAEALYAGGKTPEGDEDVVFVLEFESLSASDLPEMDGATQGAANIVVQTMAGSGGGSSRSARPPPPKGDAPAPVDAATGYGATGVTQGQSLSRDVGSDESSGGSIDAGAAVVETNGESGVGEGAFNGRGYCDPYCVFHGDGVAELAEGQYETEVVKETQRPRWEPEQVPCIALLDDSAALLRRRYLTVTVMDEDVGSADDVVGHLLLWLGDGWLSPEDSDSGADGIVARARFSRQITFSGRRRGRLDGEYVIRRVRPTPGDSAG